MNHVENVKKIDSHMHIWNPKHGNNPWLSEDHKISFRYGDYKSIRKPYFLNNYQEDFYDSNIVGCIFVETEWKKWGIEEEIEFALQNNSNNFIKGIICQGWVDDNFKQQINIINKYSLVRGIRQKPRVIPYDSFIKNTAYPGTVLNFNFMEGLALLEENDKIFEIQTAWWHLPDLAIVCGKFPNLKVVINHAGMPVSRDPDILKKWAEALSSIAMFDNVYIKLSGFGEINRWEYDRNFIIYSTITEVFDNDHILFASNFPVDKVVVTAKKLMHSFETFFNTFDERIIENIFFNNAFKLYKLEGDNL